MPISKNPKKNGPIRVNLSLHYPEESGSVMLEGLLEFTEPQSQFSDSALSRNHRQALVHRLQRIHDWEREHFPNWTPRISHELFKLLGEGKPGERAYTVKEIVHATGFSERAVRKQLDRFESHGWITRGKNDLDRRNSHIQPSETLKSAYQNWLSLHLTP